MWQMEAPDEIVSETRREKVRVTTTITEEIRRRSTLATKARPEVWTESDGLGCASLVWDQ